MVLQERALIFKGARSKTAKRERIEVVCWTQAQAWPKSHCYEFVVVRPKSDLDVKTLRKRKANSLKCFTIKAVGFTNPIVHWSNDSTNPMIRSIQWFRNFNDSTNPISQSNDSTNPMIPQIQWFHKSNDSTNPMSPHIQIVHKSIESTNPISPQIQWVHKSN